MSIITSSTRHSRQARRPRRRFRPSLLIFLCGVCGTSLWLGVVAAHPFVMADHWKAENDRLARQLLQCRLQNQRDEREVRALQTPQGIKQAARQLGFVEKQEHRLRIPNG